MSALSWPTSRLGEALAALAHQSGLSPRDVEVPPGPEPSPGDGQRRASWLELMADGLGLEAEQLRPLYTEVPALLQRGGPALLEIRREGVKSYLALLGTRRHSALVLDPELRVHRIPLQQLRAELCQELEAPLVPSINEVLEAAAVPRRRRARARAALLNEQLRTRRLSPCWLLRPYPGVSPWYLARHTGLLRRAGSFIAAHACQSALWVLSWWLLGNGALEGRLDAGWLLAWALLLLTMVPLRLLASWSAGTFALRAGGLVKQRLLAGAMALPSDQVRHQGVGQLLGRVIEADAVESLGLSGGLLGLMASVELLIATAVLWSGASGPLHVALLVGVLLCVLGWAWRYFHHRRQWTDVRLEMTHDLIERMVGHRTRLAQESPEHWHDGEDQALTRYMSPSASMDQSALALSTVAPRGWLVLGLLGLAPGVVAGTDSPTALAISLGGVLLAYRGLSKLATGLIGLSGAVAASQQFAPVFQAAARRELPELSALGSSLSLSAAAPAPGQPLIDGKNLSFRYPGRSTPVLQGCDLQIRAGDRLLLQGASGGGKSTLGSLLVGLREPESGLLLLNGLDRRSLGLSGWRKRVAAAPQFHENHVLTGTFSFNLLMGRAWPARPEDTAEAESLCRQLGLGGLLDRMPAGLNQMVGETGWQLSHGERSRLFLARALLQNAQLIVLDESFAALDPETLDQVIRCVLDRAPSLVVIAHP